jgi:hypothetical protein
MDCLSGCVMLHAWGRRIGNRRGRLGMGSDVMRRRVVPGVRR